MTRFGSLVRVFLRDLVRRRMIWGLVLLTVGIVAINYGAVRTMRDAIGNGETWDMATRRASSQLDSFATGLRGWLSVVVVLIAALVAPESRRNGTTQFVLSLGVSRNTLAAAQFAALTAFILAATLIVHGGFAAAGLWTGALTGREVALGWTTLLVPLLAPAAAAFALSLTASPLETYLVFIGGPLVTRVVPSLAQGFPDKFPQLLVRALENVGLFFPEINEIIPWPHLSYGSASGPPYPQLGWPLAHLAAAVGFWVVLGLWFQRHHDFGSRTAVK
jgi:hypothetical protein